MKTYGNNIDVITDILDWEIDEDDIDSDFLFYLTLSLPLAYLHILLDRNPGFVYEYEHVSSDEDYTMAVVYDRNSDTYTLIWKKNSDTSWIIEEINKHLHIPVCIYHLARDLPFTSSIRNDILPYRNRRDRHTPYDISISS